MRREQVDQMVLEINLLLQNMGNYLDTSNESTMRKSLLLDQCVKVCISNNRDDCPVKVELPTDKISVRFIRDDVEDLELRKKFEDSIDTWIAKNTEI